MSLFNYFSCINILQVTGLCHYSKFRPHFLPFTIFSRITEKDGGLLRKETKKISLLLKRTNLSQRISPKFTRNSYLGVHVSSLINKSISPQLEKIHTLKKSRVIEPLQDGIKVEGWNTKDPNVFLNLDDNGVVTISGSGHLIGYDESETIPWANSTDLFKQLVIGENILSIGKRTFYYCDDLNCQLFFPSQLNSIGESAFQYCISIQGPLILPDSITSIGPKAFFNCHHLNGTLIIPPNLLHIESSVFESCSFSGSLNLSNCSSLSPRSFHSNGFDGTLTLPAKIQIIPPEVFTSCPFSGNLVFPDTILRIENSAFWGCRWLTGSLILPRNLQYLGELAFYLCSGFTNGLTLPNSLIFLGASCFSTCDGFTGPLKLPNNISTIEQYVFLRCSFPGSLVIPNCIREIKQNAFLQCSKFTELILSENLISIGDNAFQACFGFISSLILPRSLRSLSASAFKNCNNFAGDLVIPSGLTTLESGTFSYCGQFKKVIYCGLVDFAISGVFANTISSVEVQINYSPTTFCGIPVKKIFDEDCQIATSQFSHRSCSPHKIMAEIASLFFDMLLD